MNSGKDDSDKKSAVADTKKFMFDLHSFDPPEVEEEELVPPPPSFSEEELAAAKQQGFDAGHKQALEESAESREQYISQQLQVIAANYAELFREEATRTDRFEREVLSLCLVMFNQAFPALAEEHGQNEVEAVIRDVFTNNEGLSEIVVHVRSEDKDEIEACMELMNPRPDYLVCTADDSLMAGAVKMKWKDGGAIRDPEATGKKIADILIKTLARSELNDQNQSSEDGENES
jgi:flagellar assembly protein FliH|tara:strand:- start:293933 stop:294631 length:699 start_codon:yes stop_codon:yes gene_type:complete